MMDKMGLSNALSRLRKAIINTGVASTAIWIKPSTRREMILPIMRCLDEIEVRIISLMRFSFSSTTVIRNRLPQSAINIKNKMPIKKGIIALPSALVSLPSVVILWSSTS